LRLHAHPLPCPNDPRHRRTSLIRIDWDIIGKATSQPIYNLWGGGCHEPLRAYANGWYRGPRTPECFAAKAQLGYTAIKFDPFGSDWRTRPRYEFDLSLDIIRAVSDAMGSSVIS